MTKAAATSLATQFHIELGRNFFTLPSSEVGKVLEAADHVKYRKPRNANGSRGRYFYEAMNRAARRKERRGKDGGREARPRNDNTDTALWKLAEAWGPVNAAHRGSKHMNLRRRKAVALNTKWTQRKINEPPPTKRNHDSKDLRL